MGASIWTDLPTVEGDRVRRLRRAEYDALVAAGAFEGEPLELIRGVIVRMSPQGAPHAAPIVLLNDLLVRALGDRAFVRVQLPLAGPDESEPEPDLAVVPRELGFDDHPSQASLIIEVARTSQDYDRDTKGPLYAEMGVAEYWLVDVAARAVEVRRDPKGGVFCDTRVVTSGEVRLAAFPDVSVAVQTLFR
ncbi:MAG: Uma2 family endonuclease [Myxococcota bacterium]